MEERSLSIRARKKVKAEIEKAEREKHLMLFQRRMELARNGATAFREGKIRESLQNYYGYLDVLERSKNIPRGKLDPKYFDQKKDIAELLLLSGVFWDLAKIYDRGGKKSTDKVLQFLDMFVTFSSGMPFQKISAELVRKFLVNGMPKHRAEFKDTHIRLGGGKCFIATAVEDYCEPQTLPLLRRFRDQYLLKRAWGRGFVRVYYRLGPGLARLVLRTPEGLQKKIAKKLDQVAKQTQV